MNFLLSDEQTAAMHAVRSVLAAKCSARDVHRIVDADLSYDEALWRELCAFGIGSIIPGESHGGLGLKLIDLAIMAELLGEFAAPVPFLGHSLAILAIELGADANQRALWLPRLATGELLGTIALAEPGGGWLAHEWQARGDASLSGTKHLVPFAAEADLIVVGTREGLVVVERGASYTCTRAGGIDRTRQVDTVEFENARTSLVTRDRAIADRVTDAAAVLLAADAFGGAFRVTSMAVEYAKVREQYGRPIGAFQALAHQLADMALWVEPSRGLYWFAAHAWDAIPEKRGYAAAQAKAHLTDVFLETARAAVEAHGGIGFTWEHEAHVHLKRAMFDWAWLGQPERHRLRAADLAGW